MIAGLVIAAPMAHVMGQAFRGTLGATQGQVIVDRGTAGEDHIMINSSTAVIDWAPDETGTGTINFLPAGTTVSYSSPFNGFTVLNRVVPTVDPSRAISLNGTVNFPNGNVWFYSPGGILVGGTAAFNVGSLLLTSSKPNGSDTNNFLTTDGSGTHFSLAPATNGSSSVVISSGARINATQPGSYIALIAPSITQSGMVTVNGSAAYVAAEAANITINNGLFDISIPVNGESTATGPQLIHDGSTGMTFTSSDPQAAPGVNNLHRVYVVAVPKNDAITMLIQGGSDLGFDIAGGATVQGSAIILSAGRNITDATSNGANPFASSAATGANASIAINTGNFRSAVNGNATHNAIVSNGGTFTSINFASDLTLTAPNLVSISSTDGQHAISIGRNLLLDASVAASTDGSTVTAGTAQVFATGGGTVTVGGNLDIEANAVGIYNSGNTIIPVSATAGTAQIFLTGGTVDVAGDTILNANAMSGSAQSAPTSSPVLTGGLAKIEADGTSAVNLHGNLTASASAAPPSQASPDYDIAGNVLPGASRQGGNVSLQNSGGGTLTVDESTSLYAIGTGQNVMYGPVAGAGTGGQIDVSASDGAITLSGGLSADARGTGGFSAASMLSGGSGTGGQITVGAANAAGMLTIGQVDSSSSLMLNASGDGQSGDPGGGNGIGGQVHLVANGGTTHVFGPTYLYASGDGSSGTMSGGGAGGFVEINSAGGMLTLDGPAQLYAAASSGMGGNDGTNTPQTGNALGGTAQIVASGTGQVVINGDVMAHAGASVPRGDVSANAGGNGTGGTFNLFGSDTGTIHVAGAVDVDVNANGGDNQFQTGIPGIGIGGKMFVDARDGSSITIDDILSAEAGGAGGNTISGIGGAGTGGLLSVGGGSGTLTLDSVYLQADGHGGTGLFQGGTGSGGTGSGGSVAVHIFTAGGSIAIDSSVDMSAAGFGGAAQISSLPMGVTTTGGTGIGGSASVDAEHGSITIGNAMAEDSHILIDTSGFGGMGLTGGMGMGGGIIDPTGGSTIFAVAGSVIFTPSTSSERPTQVALSANGQGGVGGTAFDGSAGQGGVGTGGFAGIQANSTALMTDRSTITLPTTVSLTAGGLGGRGGTNSATGVGGTGGAGNGGATFLVSQAGNGNISVSTLMMDTEGTGGGGGGGVTGGVGGVGTGGFNQAGVFSTGLMTTYTQGVAALGDLTSIALGTGGAGGTGTTAGGTGGAGQGGNAALISRGGMVTAASALLNAVGHGGNGGSGQSGQGVGGNGTGGSVGLLSTYRYQTSVTGSLAVTGQVVGAASGVAGTGSQSGQIVGGNFQIQALGSTLSASDLAFSGAGTTVPANAVASEVSAVGTGAINVTNTFMVSSPGDIGLYFDQGGTLNAASAVISARSVTPFGGMDTAAPTGTGVFQANSLTFNILQDFQTNTSFSTPGAFTLANITGAIRTGNINATTAISLDFGTLSPNHSSSTVTGNLTTNGVAFLQSNGNVTTGSVTAGDSIIIVSTSGTATLGNLSAGLVNPVSNSGPGYVAQVFAANGSTIGSVAAKGEIRFQTLNGSVTAGNINTGRDLVVLAKQNVSLGAITTNTMLTVMGSQQGPMFFPGGVYIGHSDGTNTAASALFPVLPTRVEGSITINGPVSTGLFEAASASSFSAAAITATDYVNINAGGAITLSSLTGHLDIDVDGDGAFTAGSVDSAEDTNIKVNGQITVGTGSAGRIAANTNSQASGEPMDNPTSSPSSSPSGNSDNSHPGFVLVGNAGVTLGSASAAGDIGLVSNGNVVAGTLVADDSVGALVGGNVTLGSVTTGADTNGLYIGNSSLYPLVKDTDGNAADILFAMSPPPAVGGSIVLAGPVSAGRIEASAAGSFTANAIATDNGIDIVSGDVATFNGAVTGPTIAISSGDLSIGSSGSLTSSTGLKLTSTNAQTTIGSMTTGASSGQSGLATSYTLDNAEFGRLHAAQIDFAAASDITLGTLNIIGSASLTGNLIGSNARFQVQTPGSIRVVGSVNLANAAATDMLSFLAGQRFEIVTPTGQVQVLGANGQVGGILNISATNAAVGTSSLLSQLQSDPKFAGRDALLASAPLIGSKPAGYIQAGRMNFTIGNTLLIQNSGVGSTLAGFTVGTGGIKIAGAGTTPIDVVIYGQALDSSGAALPTSSIGSAVTASQTTSTANVDGCAFVGGVCSPVDTGAAAQTVAQTQLASISASVQSSVTGNVGSSGATSNTAPGSSSSSSSSNSSSSDDDEEGSGSKSSSSGGKSAAAAKPNVLIDTSSIAQTANTQIDTPVTSSGNTSLWSGEDGLAGVTGTNP